MVKFGLLGEVTAHVAGQPVAVGPARQRLVLAALIADANHVVSIDRLVERVWGADPPQRARAVLSSYVSRLRQALGSAALAWRSGGYVLVVDRSAVDVHRFRDLCDQARATTDDVQAATLLSEALRLWRGPALTGLDGQWVFGERDRLHQQRRQAEHDLTDALLRAGHGEDLVAELSTRATEHPLDERAAGQYMVALYRAGRTADALEHYRRIRSRLADELGTDPGSGLQDLHQRILHGDPTLTGPTRPPTATPAQAPVPLQLPAAPALFTGRDSELAALTALLDESGHQTIVISALAGAGGIGKTWLASQWAHQHLGRFPDGQLFVDLRGFCPDGQPMPAATAVRGFLDALAVDPARIPADPHAQAALWRSLVVDKRMLIVLDNAADSTQITPLLPGSHTCTVLVTSRNHLTGLITGHGAHHLPIDVLADTDARALLTDRLGAARMAAEPDAIDDLLACCGGYPLALSIVTSRAATHPHLRLTTLTHELQEARLAALDNDDPTASLSAVLSWSVNALTTEQARVFGLLGLAPGPDISLDAAGSLTGLSTAQTHLVLRRLEQASLLHRDAEGRYRMHDLIRHYANQQAHHDQTDNDRDTALQRVIDFYLHTAHAGDRLLNPHRPPVQLDPPVPGCHPHPLSDQAAALSWFDAEHAVLLASQQAAIARGWHQVVWQLAWTLGTFHWRRAHLHDQLAAWRAGLSAADHVGDPVIQALAHRLLGYACGRAGQRDQALANLQQSLSLAESVGDLYGQADTHRYLAWIWGQRGQHQQSLEHTGHGLRLFRILEDPVREATMLNNMGYAAARLNDFDQARTLCEQALTINRRTHQGDGEATTLDSLGYIAHQTGQYHQALDYYRQALTVFHDLGDTYFRADTLEHLGHSHSALGSRKQARAAWQEALELYQAQHRTEDADRVQQQLDTLD